MKTHPTQLNWKTISAVAAICIIVSGIILWSYQVHALNQTLRNLENSTASSTAASHLIIAVNRETIAATRKENDSLRSSLSAEQIERLGLEKVKVENEKKIDTLTKLTTLDPELLKKYSKVYFLSENYVPPILQEINPAHVIDESKNNMILAQVSPFLDDMFAAATKDSIPLMVLSAFRSFGTQKDIKSGYRVTYGAGTANQFSAEQGYSEHQLATTLDFTTPTLKGADLSFENTATFKWLTENAYKYGFILSYPKANGYYQYEPWHWRFVGRTLAKDLHDQGKHFYEYDQRVIDTYLIKIFD